MPKTPNILSSPKSSYSSEGSPVKRSRTENKTEEAASNVAIGNTTAHSPEKKPRVRKIADLPKPASASVIAQSLLGPQKGDSLFQAPKMGGGASSFLSRGKFRAPSRTPFKATYCSHLNADGELKGSAHYASQEDLEGKIPFYKNAVAVQQNSELNYQGRTVKIDIQEQMMNGQFKVIAKIAPEELPLISGIPNDQLLVTTFRDHCIMVTNLFGDKLQNNAHLNVLREHDQLKSAGIPVAEIYNKEEVAQGCGFFLVEYVPHPFELFWEKGTKISDMTATQLGQLDMIKGVFQQTYSNQIIADLQPNNFRVKEDGTPVLVDFRENAIDEDELDLTFRNMLLSFACEKNDEIYNYLNPTE